MIDLTEEEKREIIEYGKERIKSNITKERWVCGIRFLEDISYYMEFNEENVDYCIGFRINTDIYRSWK